MRQYDPVQDLLNPKLHVSSTALSAPDAVTHQVASAVDGFRLLQHPSTQGCVPEECQKVKPKACSIPGCVKAHIAKGLCSAHYAQAKRGKAPSPIAIHDPPTIAPAPVFDSDVARAAAAAISDLLSGPESGVVWHKSLAALVHALASGSAERLQEAVLANQLMLLTNLPGDAPVPETL